MSLSVEMRDLLPIMAGRCLQLRVSPSDSGAQWTVCVRGPRGTEWSQWSRELWQGLDAALAWIWQEYGGARSEESEAREADQTAYDAHADAALAKGEQR